MELPQTKRAKMPHGRPDSMDSFDDDYERDYENVDPSEAPSQQQVQPQWQGKAEPAVFTSKATEQRGCGRKSLVILYVLVGVSLLVSTAAIVLIFLKGAETAKQLELLHFNQSTMRSTGAELARDLKRLQSDQATLKVEGAELARDLKRLQSDQATLKVEGAELSRDLKRLQSDQATLKVEVSEGLAKAKNDSDDIRAEANKILAAVEKWKVATHSICPAGWLPNAGNCYYFSTVPQNWSNAKQACTDQGAQLIIIENQQEQEFLTKNSNGKNYWIGLNDIDKEGTFKWINDCSVSYRNWNQGEPNDAQSSEDCAYMYGNGKWNDAACEISQDGWICEKKGTC